MPAVLQSTVRILILPDEELGRFTTAMVVCLALQAVAVAAMVSRQVSAPPPPSRLCCTCACAC